MDSATSEQGARFETIPQCVVTMNEMDYRWVSKVGRKADDAAPVKRLHDMSLTRNDSFLRDQAPSAAQTA